MPCSSSAAPAPLMALPGGVLAMGVPLLCMPERESRADERVVGLKSTGIVGGGQVVAPSSKGGGKRARGEG
eukprot:scaffold56067_cov37-Phaeocystis_antarctica.AAC.2